MMRISGFWKPLHFRYNSKTGKWTIKYDDEFSAVIRREFKSDQDCDDFMTSIADVMCFIDWALARKPLRA